MTTEVWWLWDETSYNQNTWFLLALIIGGAFLPMKNWLTKWPKLGFLLVSLFLITLVAHQKYSRFYDQLQQYPKVKSISKDWGIPGSWVKITGRNFGEEWEPGRVYFGDAEMIIKKWENKEVIFEVTTEVEKGNKKLSLTNKHNKTQKEIILFEVK